jgi:hypothetical protein
VEVCTPAKSIDVHRKEKRNKLRAKLGAAPPGERAAIEAKLQRTYSLFPAAKPSK